MTAPSQAMFLYLKLGIVGVFLVGVFLLAALARIDATAAIAAATGGVGLLVVALGISASGSAQADARRAVGAPSTMSTVNAVVAPAPEPALTLAALQTQLDALKAKGGQAGFGMLRLLGILSIVGILGVIIFHGRAMNIREMRAVNTHETVAQVAQQDGTFVEPVALEGCTGQVNPQFLQIGVDSLATLACGLVAYAADTQTSPVNWGQVAIDLATKCGMDVEAIIKDFGATSPVAVAAQANAGNVHAAAAAGGYLARQLAAPAPAAPAAPAGH